MIKKYKKQLFILRILSFLVSILPLLIVFFLKRNVYMKTTSQTLKLCIGGIILLIFVFLKVVGKLKLPSGVKSFFIVFVLSYLLESILQDLVLLSGMALIGEVTDSLFFQNNIKKLQQKIEIEKTADVTSQKLEEIVKRYISNE